MRKLPELETFSERLKELINTQSGGKHTVFAKYVGIPISTFQNIVNGQLPKAEHLLLISKKCDVSIDWLLTGTGPPYNAASGSEAHHSGEAQARYGCCIQTDLLKDIIQCLEKGIDEGGLVLDPEKKAEVVALVYEAYAGTGRKIEEEMVKRYLHLLG